MCLNCNNYIRLEEVDEHSLGHVKIAWLSFLIYSDKLKPLYFVSILWHLTGDILIRFYYLLHNLGNIISNYFISIPFLKYQLIEYISIIIIKLYAYQFAFSSSFSSILILIALTTLFSSPLVSYTTAFEFFSSVTVSKFFTKYWTVFLTSLSAFQTLLSVFSLKLL